ncbi:MAG TPA: hypothetical protein VGB36_07810, partial [Gammaproteobacteria bacterium]
MARHHIVILPAYLCNKSAVLMLRGARRSGRKKHVQGLPGTRRKVLNLQIINMLQVNIMSKKSLTAAILAGAALTVSTGAMAAR